MVIYSYDKLVQSVPCPAIEQNKVEKTSKNELVFTYVCYKQA